MWAPQPALSAAPAASAAQRVPAAPHAVAPRTTPARASRRCALQLSRPPPAQRSAYPRRARALRPLAAGASAAASDDGDAPAAANTPLPPPGSLSGGLICAGGPVLATQRFRASRGVRAGGIVYVEGPDGALQALVSRDVRGSLERMRAGVTGLLLPEGGTNAVTSDYWTFTKFSFLRIMASSAGAVLGTRSMLRAVGVGAAAAAAGSAALNWVLKDGLGRCGAIAAASAIGNRFDNDSKTYFLAGDIAYELGVGIELCAPLFPGLFLLVGSLANALKSTSYMMRLPPRAAFLKSFARRENVGDLSAKANAQEVVAGMIGMGLGIALSSAVGDALHAAFFAYAVTLTTVTTCSYLGLRGLRLVTLNWARMRLLLRAYMRCGGAAVPGPREVNAREPMPSWPLLPRRAAAADWTLPVRFGAALDATAPTTKTLRRLAELYASERYLLSIAPGDDDEFARKPWHARLLAGRRRGRTVINVAVAEDATARDCLLAMLQAARLQELLQSERGDGAGRFVTVALRDEAYAVSLLDRSYRTALAEAPRLLALMADAGWNTNVVLWTPQHLVDWSAALPAPELRCPLPAQAPPPASADDEAASEGQSMRAAAVAEAADDLDVLAMTRPQRSK
jgi:hypothetical protein